MAGKAGMSAPHFYARFREVFGLPPMECLIRYRLQHAAWLLTDKNLQVAEVARRSGYEDPFHFSKVFKKRFGRSPCAWRESFGSG
jgi:AraC-like DNA-binding protein